MNTFRMSGAQYTALALLCSVVCIVVWVLSRPDPLPDITITVNADGFHPAEVVVGVGSRVRFLNAGDDWYWPASNSHPTHELYPAFDPREPIAPGDYWDFTADTAGYWAFHDHLRPQIRGMLEVRP